MRTVAEIDRELAAKRRQLQELKGTETEIYSRIVGYYRSVRNWNKGKREEFGKRLPFRAGDEPKSQQELAFGAEPAESPRQSKDRRVDAAARDGMNSAVSTGRSVASCTYFFRRTCPSCKPVRALLSEYPIAIHEVDVDTEDGMALAIEHQILATPTALFSAADGTLVRRSCDPHEIAEFLRVAG